MFKQVCDFNLEVLGIQQRPVGMLSDNEFAMSVTSLQEELDEFSDAYFDDSAEDLDVVVDAVDAMIDLMYFATGVMYKHGLTPDDMRKCFDAVHSANMTKAKGKNAKRDHGDAADAVKPESFVDPKTHIKQILEARSK